jgi:glycosyltransferase involved in cell wall biosynthesis
VVLTKQNRDFVLQHVGICIQVLVIPNGLAPRSALLNAQARTALRCQLNIPNAAFVVLAVGRLVDVKNLAVPISAVELLRGAIPGLLVMLLGDGPERASLQRQIDALALTDTCQLLGHRTNVQAYGPTASERSQCSRRCVPALVRRARRSWTVSALSTRCRGASRISTRSSVTPETCTPAPEPLAY